MCRIFVYGLNRDLEGLGWSCFISFSLLYALILTHTSSESNIREAIFRPSFESCYGFMTQFERNVVTMMLTVTLVLSTEAILAMAGVFGTSELAAMTAIRGLTYFT